MPPWLQVIVTVVCSVLASSGLWSYIMILHEKKDAKTEMLVGLAHDRILALGMSYIERGYITHDEYENLNSYLFEPYEKLGGNGSAKKVMLEVNKLPMHSHP